MSRHFFITPHDVLFLRGNKLFGDAGSYGESLVPPWPSMAAGALRSALLVHDEIDLAGFAAGSVQHASIGNVDQPGAFAISGFHLARKSGHGIETLHALPADLHVISANQDDDRSKLLIRRLVPNASAPGIQTSASLAKLATLATDTQSKPETGLWLTQSGFADYLAGQIPQSDALVKSQQLLALDPRVGVALEAASGRARDGALFTSEAVALHDHVGFIAGAEGAEGLPDRGLLRLGGDARAASFQQVEHQPAAISTEDILNTGRCRLVLTAPGIFDDGWLPPGMTCDGDSYRFELHGVSGRLVCAAVPRAEVVSGWDLAQRQPKPALRVAATGSVYWLEELAGDTSALCKLANHGLWPASAYDTQRRAEGFNRFVFATY